MPSTHERTVGILSIGVPYFDVATANRYLAATRALLDPHYRLVGPAEMMTDPAALDAVIDDFQAAHIAALLLQIGTFPDGDGPARLADRLDVPVVIHALPEPRLDKEIALNSLCGASVAAFTLAALDRHHIFCFGDPQDPAVQQEILSRVNAATSLQALRGSRLGLIGFRAPGFYPCTFDELLLRRELGLAIDHVALSELERALAEGERRKAPRDRFPLIGGGDLPEEAVARMERYFAALSSVVHTSSHHVIAIKDWPEFFEAEVAGGFWPALGWLQEDGIVVAPEGDVNAAVTMALQHNLTGTIPTLVDVAAWEDRDSTLLLWHYGGAESLARDRAEIRFDRWGREVEYTFKPGLATLARIGLHRGRLRLLTVAVEVQDRRVTLRRAAGWARTVNTSAGEVMRRVIDDGWEHHPCLVYGDLSVEFASIARLAGMAHTAL